MIEQARFASVEVALDQARRRVVGWPRRAKRTVMVAADLLILALTLWLAMSVRHGELYVPSTAGMALVLAAGPLIGAATLYRLGLYRHVTRFIGQTGARRIFAGVGLAVLLWVLVITMSHTTVPRSVIVIYAITGWLLIWALRHVAAWALRSRTERDALRSAESGRRTPVAIYGAGEGGVLAFEALRYSAEAVPVAFIDSEPTLQRQFVCGLKVYAPNRLPALIAERGVEQVVIALPDVPRQERSRIARWLNTHPVAVHTMPSVEDVVTGRRSVSDIRPIRIEDLLGRDPAPADPTLLSLNIRDKTVLVAGAGGSIGSELSRRILALSPRRLVLVDVSEAALYEIDRSLRTLLEPLDQASRPEIVIALGSVGDRQFVRRVLRSNDVETIYHAAAYKHVPMIESNPMAGLRNNTFATEVLAQEASAAGVERMVLVSTDKAVRPTSMMGASKRLAELVLQAESANTGSSTVFTMVRFGNVLGSSGSVVPLFRSQIEAGGPVTITHPDMVRFFMSIPEAVDLVIQAGAMAEGGDVFVLDMGEPIRILDLAHSMIALMGRTVRDATNADGDIAIEVIGLRPGEKLHEELFIGNEIEPTVHPRICRSIEPSLPADALRRELEVIRSAMEAGATSAVLDALARTVEGFATATPSAAPRHSHADTMWFDRPATATVH